MTTTTTPIAAPSAAVLKKIRAMTMPFALQMIDDLRLEHFVDHPNGSQANGFEWHLMHNVFPPCESNTRYAAAHAVEMARKAVS